MQFAIDVYAWSRAPNLIAAYRECHDFVKRRQSQRVGWYVKAVQIAAAYPI
jgi:hypothetical protein